MTAHRSLNLLALYAAAVLSACGQVTQAPAAQTTSARLQTLEECHGCGRAAGRPVGQFWFEAQVSSEEMPISELGDRPAPAHSDQLALRTVVAIGAVADQSPPYMELGASDEAGTDPELPLACMSTVSDPGNAPKNADWKGHRVDFTSPVDRQVLTSLSAANAICTNTFGTSSTVFEEPQGDLEWVMGMPFWFPPSDPKR